MLPVPGIKPEYPIAAVPGNTTPQPTSPWVLPGKYTVVLTVDGQKYSQPLTVEMDPRVKTPLADLQKQFELSYQVYQDLQRLQPAIEKATATLAKIKSMREKAGASEAAKLDEAGKQLQTLLGGERRRRRGPQPQNLTGLRSSLQQLLTMLQDVDRAPTQQTAAEVPKLHQAMSTAVEDWKRFEQSQLAPLGLNR